MNLVNGLSQHKSPYTFKLSGKSVSRPVCSLSLVEVLPGTCIFLCPMLMSYDMLLAMLLVDFHTFGINTFLFIGIFLEPSVRVELMEQVPHVAVYCYEHHSMMEAVPQYILFIVLRFLTDSNNQVSTK